MSLQLLQKIQELQEVYAVARKHYDAAFTDKKDTAAEHYFHLLTAVHQELMPLITEFSSKYADVHKPLNVGETVVWKRGAVGLQGEIVKDSINLKEIKTDNGIYSEYSCNLIPFNMVLA